MFFIIRQTKIISCKSLIEIAIQIIYYDWLQITECYVNYDITFSSYYHTSLNSKKITFDLI